MYDNEISNLIPEIKAPLDILFAKATVNYESKILSGFFPSKLQAYPKIKDLESFTSIMSIEITMAIQLVLIIGKNKGAQFGFKE